jgi:hypothetical protein
MTDDICDSTPMLDRETETVVSWLIFIFSFYFILFYFQLLLTNKPSKGTQVKNAVTMLILFLINLLNYMDRFAIAGIL